MATHPTGGLGSGSQGFANADEQGRTSYSTSMLYLSPISPDQHSNSGSQASGMRNTSSPNGYSRGPPGQVDHGLVKSQAHRGYASRQAYLGEHNAQPYAQVDESNGGYRHVQRDFVRYPADSEGALTQFRQPATGYPSAGIVFLNEPQGMCCNSQLPPSSLNRNSEPMSLEIHRPQYLTPNTSSSSPPGRRVQGTIPNFNGPASVTNTPPPQVISERCPYRNCPQVFTGESRKGNMSRHIKNKHGASGRGSRQFPCADPGCEKTFKRKDARLNHERKEHPELGRLPAVPRKPLSQVVRSNTISAS